MSHPRSGLALASGWAFSSKDPLQYFFRRKSHTLPSTTSATSNLSLSRVHLLRSTAQLLPQKAASRILDILGSHSGENVRRTHKVPTLLLPLLKSPDGFELWCPAASSTHRATRCIHTSRSRRTLRRQSPYAISHTRSSLHSVRICLGDSSFLRPTFEISRARSALAVASGWALSSSDLRQDRIPSASGRQAQA
jgi:hypothetical protein